MTPLVAFQAIKSRLEMSRGCKKQTYIEVMHHDAIAVEVVGDKVPPSFGVEYPMEHAGLITDN